jgi:protoheme ferro-lyase
MAIRPHDAITMEKTSIILTALGGPLSLAEVGPFMNAFMGRPWSRPRSSLPYRNVTG